MGSSRQGMAPSKPRPAPFDDSRSETSSLREKFGHVTTVINEKGRRVTSNLLSGSSTRDSANAVLATATSVPAGGGNNQDNVTGIQWSTMEPSTLMAYRHAYRLNSPSAFVNSYSQVILSRPGIGRFSPTMARRKEQRRQSKEQLATAVRKHFNGMAIQESDAIVEFLYKVKFQDKAFRMRFAPQKTR